MSTPLKPDNYAVANVHLEYDNRGWVLGESFLGEFALGQADDVAYARAWVDLLSGFTSVAWSHSVQVDNGAQFRAEAGTLTLSTENLTYAQRLFGRPVRLRLGATGVEWLGKVTAVDVSMVPDGTKANNVRYELKATCTDRIAAMNKTILVDFTAPRELARERAARLWPSLTAGHWDLFFLSVVQMPAITTPVTKSVLSLLQDVLDAAQAFLVQVNGALSMTSPGIDANYHGTAVTTGVQQWTFYDTGHTPGAFLRPLRTLDASESFDDVVTSVVATNASTGVVAKAQTTAQGSAVNGVDLSVPVDVDQFGNDMIGPWVARFPLQGVPSLQAKSLTADLDYSAPGGVVTLPQVADLAAITLAGNDYSAAIIGVSHNLTPGHWASSLSLGPHYLIAERPSIYPAAPVITVTNTTPGTVVVSWTADPRGSHLTAFRYVSGAVPYTTPGFSFGIDYLSQTLTLAAGTWTFCVFAAATDDTSAWTRSYITVTTI